MNTTGPLSTAQMSTDAIPRPRYLNEVSRETRDGLQKLSYRKGEAVLATPHFAAVLAEYEYVRRSKRGGHILRRAYPDGSGRHFTVDVWYVLPLAALEGK